MTRLASAGIQGARARCERTSIITACRFSGKSVQLSTGMTGKNVSAACAGALNTRRLTAQCDQHRQAVAATLTDRNRAATLETYMDNQHQLIKGYRDLNEEEISLINEIKANGENLKALSQLVLRHVNKQMQVLQGMPGSSELSEDEIEAELNRLHHAEPEMWAGTGIQRLQEGLMFLTRAVAQPTTF